MNNILKRNRRLPAWLLWTLTALCFLAIGYLLSILNPVVIRYGDSVQYWAAGRMTVTGENPYSAELVEEYRHRANIFVELPEDAPSMMLYPPWTLPFLLPFGIFDYQLSRLMWFVFHLLISFLSAFIIWNLYKGPHRYYWLAAVIAFLFPPTLYMLLMGHITSLHLLGLLGFLYFISFSKPSKWTDFVAGASIALTTIKPQLLILLLLAVFFWVIKQRRWWVLIGSVLFAIVGTLIPLMFNPLVVSQYWSAMVNYPVGAWASPAIGTVIRRAVGYHIEWLQILPTVLGLIWLVYYWLRNRNSWSWFETAPVLIFASYLASPYYWPYDMIVLLLPVLIVFISLLGINERKNLYIMFSLYLLIFLATALHFFFIHNYYYLFWLVPAYLAWYLLGNWLTGKEARYTTQSSSLNI